MAFRQQDLAYRVVFEADLPRELKETSGLVCADADNKLTVNDSGNPSILYQIDNKGGIQARRTLEIDNRDWEALAADAEHLYIADIGNNSGKRPFVSIYKVPNSSFSKPISRLDIRYQDNHNVSKNVLMAHDFDAEALLALDEYLLLFSKSWKTETLGIYRINKSEAHQRVAPIKRLTGVNGVITGAAYDDHRKHVVLVGYKVIGLGFVAPFIAILSDEMTLKSKTALVGYGQVEAVCVDSQGDIWFTQESSAFSSAKLVRIRMTDAFVGSGVDTD